MCHVYDRVKTRIADIRLTTNEAIAKLIEEEQRRRQLKGQRLAPLPADVMATIGQDLVATATVRTVVLLARLDKMRRLKMALAITIPIQPSKRGPLLPMGKYDWDYRTPLGHASEMATDFSQILVKAGCRTKIEHISKPSSDLVGNHRGQYVVRADLPKWMADVTRLQQLHRGGELIASLCEQIGNDAALATHFRDPTRQLAWE
jgi:hypothetical protein